MTRAEREYLAGHRVHECQPLFKRWRMLARAAGLEEVVLGERSGYPVPAYRCPGSSGGAVNYASAGVHGDEPAAVAALVEWAEAKPSRFARDPWLVVPCFNPWGLVNNRREQEDGSDLNRSFHSDSDPLVVAWRSLVTGQEVRRALLMHEDYDARGVYIYEHGREGEPIGPLLIRRAAVHIPPEPRRTVEGRRAEGGMIRVRRRPTNLLGQPEALELHALGARRTLTVETPSEFSLYRRVAAHKKMLAAAFG